MASRSTKRFWANIATNILAAAIWETLKPLLKPLALSALSLFAFATALIRKLVPMIPWSDVLLYAVLITAGVILPLAIMTVGLRSPSRRPRINKIADFLLEGRGIRDQRPGETADALAVERWFQVVNEWANRVISYLDSNCSRQAVARFIDDSSLQDASYAGAHSDAQRPFLLLNRWLANLTAILDNPNSYC